MPSPALLDNLGLIAFTLIALDAFVDVKERKGRAHTRALMRLFIGLGGLLIDGYVVFGM